MVWDDLTPAEDADAATASPTRIAVAMAMGCSTNAIIHLVAMSRRAGHAGRRSTISTRASRKVPVIANIRPSGDKYLMEDFYYAGGMPRADDAHRAAPEAGRDDRQRPHAGRQHRRRRGVRRRRDPPRRPSRSMPRARWRCCAATSRPTAVIIKPSACDAAIAASTPGRALVFDDYPSLKAAVDDPKPRRHRRRTSSCCATPARRAARACPSGACCRSRPSC